MEFLSPTLDNPNINIFCERCGKKIMWEAHRNNGTGKIELVATCHGDRAIISIDPVVDVKVFGRR